MTSALKYCLVFLPPLELEDSVPFEAFFLSKLTHNNTYGMNWVNPVLPFIHSNLSKYSGMQVCPVTHSHLYLVFYPYLEFYSSKWSKAYFL